MKLQQTKNKTKRPRRMLHDVVGTLELAWATLRPRSNSARRRARDLALGDFAASKHSASYDPISYPESSGFLVSGGDAGRDSGIMEFLSQKIWDSGFSAHALMFRNRSQIFQKGRHCRENRQES